MNSIQKRLKECQSDQEHDQMIEDGIGLKTVDGISEQEHLTGETKQPYNFVAYFHNSWQGVVKHRVSRHCSGMSHLSIWSVY